MLFVVQIQSIHHVSLNVTDLERSRAFYREILGLQEIARPKFNFPGAWFGLPSGQHLHLIVHCAPNSRIEQGIDTKSRHFAVRTASFNAALEYLRAKGYNESAGERDPRSMRVQPHATAGFPQIYLLDPDGNIIEINAERLD